MSFQNPLFEGRDICLAPIDHEKDPEIVATWSQDAGYLRLLSTKPARPVSTPLIKKQFETLEKEMEEKKNLFYFMIHKKGEPASNGKNPEESVHLIGFVELYWIDWVDGTGNIRIGIGDAGERGKGFGGQALRLMLRYAFEELNLHRLAAEVPEYNPAARKLFSGAGFSEEVRRREALERDGRRWDLIHYGLLAGEWRNSA